MTFQAIWGTYWGLILITAVLAISSRYAGRWAGRRMAARRTQRHPLIDYTARLPRRTNKP